MDSFGTLDNVSNKSVRTIGQFEKVLGVTPEHSAGVMMQMQCILDYQRSFYINDEEFSRYS